MTEIWKDIKGYEGLYQVSNLGRVKVLERTVKHKGETTRILHEKIRKTNNNDVDLWKNGKRIVFTVSSLVAREFLTKENENDIVVHINEPDDNSVENLRYVSRRKFQSQIAKTREPKNLDIQKSLYNEAKKNSISLKMVHQRIAQGWSEEEAVSIPIKRKERTLKQKLYTYNEKVYTVNGLLEICTNGICKQTLKTRLFRGWSVDEAINIPAERKGR